MRLSLFPTEFKILVKCITALSKLGQEIYFYVERDTLILKTVNSSRSAYATVTYKQGFFEKISNSEIALPFRFKIPSRSCSNVFKLSASIEKSMQKCRLIVSPDGNLLIVQYFCKHGIVKTFNMSISDCEYLEAVYSVEQAANHLALPTKILSEVLNNFRPSTEELTLILKEGECTFQNCISQEEPTGVLTQLPLSASEFDTYSVTGGSELTFSQKELRAILAFCESVSPVLRIYCDHPGRPVVFTCLREMRLSANFVLATLPASAYAVSGSQRAQSFQSNMLPSKTPVQVRRSHNFQDSINISTVSHATLPELPTVFRTIHKTTSFASSSVVQSPVSARHTDDGVHLAPTQLVLPSSSPRIFPVAAPPPFSLPRLRHSERPTGFAQSTSAAETTLNESDWIPPAKKARSVLFAHFEQSQESDAENQSVEAMDLELLRLTNHYDRTDWRSCSQTLQDKSVSASSRTVLVPDSDEEAF